MIKSDLTQLELLQEFDKAKEALKTDVLRLPSDGRGYIRRADVLSLLEGETKS